MTAFRVALTLARTSVSASLLHIRPQSRPRLSSSADPPRRSSEGTGVRHVRGLCLDAVTVVRCDSTSLTAEDILAGLPFTKYHWNRLEKGATVVVTLTKAANVRLMDSTNFNAFKNGRPHKYSGGMVKTSPFRIPVPRTGSWYLTVDLMGLKATNVRSSVAIEPPALPVARSAARQSLQGVRHERPPVVPDEQGETWDVFISHASEDKVSVAEPLAIALRERGLKVWLDKTELRIGDSLRRKIDYGLAHSAFGIVILSSSFFAKGWPQYELDGIIGLSVNGDQRMLPIWHEISRDEIARQSPSLVDKIARNTAVDTIAEIADEIAAVVAEA
ncbi:DUF1883 domain-containing protein [Plantibacter sp. MCCC 1A11337]|uniref:DUF1883 domain-containing protein n=1 Tax=Plantibacter sp. MCCC 1A11337 TaxID=2736644 RepID=UPI001581D1A8|nr:DUF1883 domain-containing protein [Plantibacter sp. MCCC 1A11337]NUJ88833.1 DUF1883 domain-containing protein [Plantibacter sp. MCCC 1A11337]